MLMLTDACLTLPIFAWHFKLGTHGQYFLNEPLQLCPNQQNQKPSSPVTKNVCEIHFHGRMHFTCSVLNYNRL